MIDDPTPENPTGGANSNFAFFKQQGVENLWWIGIEDLREPINKESLGDYNDMIFKFTATPVPEPATMLLLGSGLLGLAGLRGKFKK